MTSRVAYRLTALALALIAGMAPSGRACSTFLLPHHDGMVFGKNYDAMAKGGYLMVNHRNVAKTALFVSGAGGASWVSKYGSITFNQVSKEYPFGGMNEAGLIVEIMWLEGTAYPDPDSRAPVPELQWIQYVLDNCESVDEVISTDESIRIAKGGFPVHFFVADRSGKAGTIDFVDKKMVSHTGAALVVPALTNHTYDASLEYLGQHQGFGGRKAITRSYDSLDRFVIVASMLKDRGALRRASPVDYAFRILDAAAQGEGTVWSTVYEMKERKILFKTVGNKETRIVSMNDFDFGCDAPALALDLEAPVTGDVSARFEPYSTELNRKLVTATFARYREVGFMDLPAGAQAYLARYPEMAECRQSER